MKMESVWTGWLGIVIFFIFPFLVPVVSGGEAASQYPASLPVQLEELRRAYSATPDNLNILIQLANAYLDAGDDLYEEQPQRIDAYQAGADFAKEALTINAGSAQAHFLYAANLGHIAQLKGVLISAFLIREIKGHVERALQLDPTHAPALHMMGMILDGLPWFLGGDAEGAVSYVEQAVAADPHYCHARLNLGKLYLKQAQTSAARAQFLLVIKEASPRGRHAWMHRHKPEAKRLLQELQFQE